jgi:hypothetical protein
MREKVLRDFFECKSSAAELGQDIAGSITRSGPKTSVVSIEDMDTDFDVTTDMIVRLCDAVLREELLPDALHAIGFALMASDRFHWDTDNNEILAEVIGDWSCPEVNYQLTARQCAAVSELADEVRPIPGETAAQSQSGQPRFNHQKEIHAEG